MKFSNKEIAGFKRELTELKEKRNSLREEIKNKRDGMTPEDITKKTEELRGINTSIDDIRDKLDEANTETRSGGFEGMKVDTITKENFRSSDKYREAFYRSFSSRTISNDDSEVMAFGKRAVTDMNGGAVTEGAGYLLPQTTLNLIEAALKEYGMLFSYIGGYNFSGTVTIPIGDSTYTDNEDGTTSLKVSFSDVVFTQEAIIVTAELKNLLLKNSIEALEAYVASELGMIIAEKLDHAVLMGDNGSFSGIVPGLTPEKYTTLNFATLTSQFGKSKGKISRRSSFVMNENTFWTEIASNVDTTGQPIQIGGQVFWSYDKDGNATVMGKPVIFTDAIGDGDVLYGDLKNRYKKNTSLDITLESNTSEQFSTDKTVVRLKIYSGGKPIRVTESFVFLVKSSDIVSTPTATPGAGAVASGTTITLASATGGSTIYFTTDGSTPTRTSTKYTGSGAGRPTITGATTVKAIAVKAGLADSNVLTAAYTVS